MAILAATQIDVARIAASDPIWLSDRFRWNRVEGKTRVGRMIDAIAFIGILKLHSFKISAADVVHGHVRHTVNRKPRSCIAAEVGMKATCSAVVDKRNVTGGIACYRPVADIQIPPIVRWKERQRLRQGATTSSIHRPRGYHRS